MSEPDPTSSASGITWGLEDLYAEPSAGLISKYQAQAAEAAQAFERDYRGKVARLDPEALAQALARMEEILSTSLRPQIYAQLRFAADTGLPSLGAALESATQKHSAIRRRLIFFELEWLALEDDQAASKTAHPALGRYDHFLRTLRLQRPHVLGEAEEKVMELLSNTGRNAFVRLFDEVSNGIRCRLAHDGGERDVSLQEALAVLHRPDRVARERAAHSITEALRDHQRVLTFILNTVVQEHADNDQLRRRPHPMHGRNMENEVDQKSVEALLSSCEARMGLVSRYYNLKRRLLGLHRLYDYDRYAPISAHLPACDFAQGREIVISAYRAFSPKMADIAQLFFENNWIDAELRPGKSGGAFCSATLPEIHPYVLLNYTDTLRDVMTLAHELGHGVHQYLSRPLGLFQFHAPLITSEAASTFGEMLVFRDLMARNDEPRVRLGLLCAKLEDNFATIFRQAVMTRFEEGLHQARRSQGELASETIGELWMAANRSMFGDSLEFTEGYALWWSYIPHFIHSPFYVYAYSYGQLLVLALLGRYEAEGEDFVPKYLDLLAAGNSDSPDALLSRMDLDVTDPNFWDLGLSVLDKMVGEAEALAESVGLA